jgi:hypothetical protein
MSSSADRFTVALSVERSIRFVLERLKTATPQSKRESLPSRQRKRLRGVSSLGTVPRGFGFGSIAKG